MIMSLKQREIKIKPRIKLNHNIYATYAVAKSLKKKHSGLKGIQTLDLCDSGAVLYQLS